MENAIAALGLNGSCLICSLFTTIIFITTTYQRVESFVGCNITHATPRDAFGAIHTATLKFEHDLPGAPGCLGSTWECHVPQ